MVAVALALAVVGLGMMPAMSAKTSATGTGAIGTQTVKANVPMDVAVRAALSASGCNNAPGPTVTLIGEISLGGLGVKLIFKNNVRGTHTYTTVATASAVVIPAGSSLSIPKQPVLGGTGGNPFIWIVFTDTKGDTLGDPIYLGRCVQGLFKANGDFVIPALASANVEGGSCSNRGSTIRLSGELKLSGLNAKILFQNNDNPVGGPHQASADASVSVVIIPAGQTIAFAKSPSLGGAGGNPWISLLFLNGKGEPVSEEFLLGRCVQDF